jgi:hypothetical protein
MPGETPGIYKPRPNAKTLAVLSFASMYPPSL